MKRELTDTEFRILDVCRTFLSDVELQGEITDQDMKPGHKQALQHAVAAVESVEELLEGERNGT